MTVSLKWDMETLLGKFNVNRKNVACFCFPDRLDVEEDGVTLALVTYDNRFLEITEEGVSSKFTFSFQIKSPEKISIFYSYEPKFKFYIIHVKPDVLVILKKSDKLSLCRRLNNVKDYTIDDSLCFGKPQVVVYFVDKTQPLVTDFLDTFEKEVGPNTISGVGLTFSSEMNIMSLRIKRQEQLLLDKKMMISRMTSSLIENSCSPIKFTYHNLVCALNGGSTSSFDTLPKNLTNGGCILKVYNSSWIICFPLMNNHKETVNNVHIYIANQQVIARRTSLFIRSGEDRFNYKNSTSLASNENGYLIGILDEPLLFKNKIHFECIVRYKLNTCDEMFQSPLEELVIEARELMNGEFTLFKKGITVEDIIALMSVSYECTLYSNGIAQDVSRALVEGLNFKQISLGCYLNDSFNNSLIICSEDCYQFYTYDKSKFLILFQNLKQLLGDVCFNAESGNVQLASEQLQNELQYLKIILFEQLNCSDYDKREYMYNEDVFKKLTDLEINTVKNISTLT